MVDDASPTLEQLRSTDARISETAWRKAYPLLWQTASRLLSFLLTGERHQQDREDIAARALAELVRGVVEKKPESFNQIASFGDVLGMTQVIVRARTKDFFRSLARHPEDATADLPEPPVETSASVPALTWTELEALITELPPPQPEIFQRHYAQGHTADEIAGQLRLPRSTVLSHLFRGRKTLREMLGRNAGDDGQPPSSP
jgi:RNA polymerase sigma factor (sigma-70 family)